MSGLVSVIMPVYNSEKYISNSLKSILNQTYQNIEVIIADDGSNDRSREIIDGFDDKRIRRFHNASNIGNIKTCNKLFARCSGEYITVQDADDISDPTRIEKQVNAFISDKQLGICGTFADYFNCKTGKFLRHKRVEVEHEKILEGMYQKFQFCGASIMVTKQVMIEVGFYREFFDGITGGHYDWSFMIVEKFKSCNIPEALYKVFVTPHSSTRNISNIHKLFSHQIIQFLARERKEKGFDSLMIEDKTALNEFIKRLEEPYIKDKSLMYIDAANKSFYSQSYENLFWNCIKAIRTEPLKLNNYKIFLSYLKKVVNRKIEH